MVGKSAVKGSSGAPKKHIPVQLMNQMGCKACPMDKALGLESPKMLPSGTSNPLIYILGEAPGETEDQKGEPFVGESGRILRSGFSREVMREDVRVSNTIRCHPPKNRDPDLPEIECCRGYVEKDIEESKPLVVIGTGNIPLHSITGMSGGVGRWRGKLIASRIGSHPFWYFPIFHPSYVLRNQRKYGKSEVEVCFEHDLEDIQRLVYRKKLKPPVIYDAPYDEGIEIITGESGSDFNRLEDILNKLAKEEVSAIDLETIGLRPYTNEAKIVTCAVGTFDKTVAFPLDHPEGGWSSNTRSKVWGLLREYLLFGGRQVAHKVGFEMEWLAYFLGQEILGRVHWEDTLAQAHTLDERPGNSLDDLTRQYFGFFLKDQTRVDVKRILQFPLREVLRYNGMDTKWDHKMFYTLQALIDAGPKEYQTEYRRKVRLEPTLVKIQLKGVPVDQDYADAMKEKIAGELVAIENKLKRCPEVIKYNQQFGTFKHTAPDDVIKLMRDICHRTEIIKEGGGSTSDEAALNLIPANEVPSAPLILEHRAASKALSTYVEPIIAKRIVMPDGRMHTQYSSMIAETGRLASEDPNIQNFPKRKRKEIRGVVVPPPGYLIVASDYGQIEARVIAMASEDTNLVKYLWTGWDVHGYWADRFIKEWPPICDWISAEFEVDRGDEKLVRKTLRQEAKNRWVFPQFFGSSYKSCAPEMHVPETIAKELSEEFWDEFKGVKRWQKKIMERYEKTMYVETLTGRRRRGALSLNQIINTPIQGTAADIVTEAMTAITERGDREHDTDLIPAINLHDDLTFFLPDDGMEDKLEIIVSEMCQPRFDFINVPLIVEVSVSEHRWHELHEIGVYKSNELFNIRNPFL